MQDSYKELIEEIVSIKLIDVEVNWIDWYKQINEFCNVTAEEYDYWKDRKVLIKDVASKSYTVEDYYTHLKDLSLFIKYNRRGLNIIDNDLQDLKNIREGVNFIATSLDSLIWDDWGRDHERLRGEYITYTEKGIVLERGYSYKFNLRKLFSIMRSSCVVKNEGGSYSNSNYNATTFYTNDREKVYITGGFLSLLLGLRNVKIW